MQPKIDARKMVHHSVVPVRWTGIANHARWRQVRRTIVFVTHSLTEAVYLGQRIAVFTARPGRIKLDIANDLPRPRAIGGAEFNRMVDLVWQQLKVESQAASASGRVAARQEILLPKE